MLLIFGLFLVLIFGYLLSLVLVEKMQSLERFGVSYLLGFGIFTLLMFCYSTLGVKITPGSTVLSLIICILLILFFVKVLKRRFFIKTSLDFLKSFSDLSKLEKVIVLVIAALAVGSLILTLYYPVNIWDAIALYDFRAKIIVQFGFYSQIANNYFWFAGYPLFTSLSHAIVYLFGGNNPQFLYTFMYLSFIFIFYSNLREFVSRKIALITTLIMASTPLIFNHSTFAYTNLPYTIFLAGGSIYLFSWLVKKKPIGFLILSAILTGLSTWTRSTEPFWMVNIFILALLSIYKFKKYLFPTLIYIVSFLPIREPWSLVNYYLLTNPGVTKTPLAVAEGGSYVTTLLDTVFNPERIREVTVFIYQNVIASWFPLLILFLFCVLVNVKDFFKKVSTLFLVIILIYFALLLYATYVYSFGIPYWNTIPDSARRMAMFFMPMMIYYVGLTFGQILSKKNEKK